MTSLPVHEPMRLSIRTPDDVLAAVPVILGFEPAASIVMLTFGGAETFHARVDLPTSRRVADLAEAVQLLVDPARHHGVRGVLLIVYSTDARRARDAERTLRSAFTEAAIEVTEVLRSDGRRWFAGGRHGEPATGVRYDAGAHRFRAEAVLSGRVVHESREDLAALLDPVPAGVEAVARAMRLVIATGVPETRATVDRALCRGRFEDVELASVLAGMDDLDVRDAAWAELRQSTAEDHVTLWTDAVQRSPDDVVGAPAAVLALAAWLSGHGALAWCAIDRSRAADPGNTLADLVSDLLVRAVPPTTWDETWAARSCRLWVPPHP